LLITSIIILPPDSSRDRILNLIIPFLHVGVVYWVTDKYMGKELLSHEAEGGEFFSGWKAAGVGIFSLFIIVAFILGFTYLLEPEVDFDQFNAKMDEFYENEDKALGYYDLLESNDTSAILYEFNNISSPKFQDNIQILNNLDLLENLPDDLLRHNELLKEYCQLQLQTIRLYKLSILEDTQNYDGQILLIQEDLDKLIDEFQELHKNSDYFIN